MESDINVFCKNFNIVDNALDMRNLRRWNGRVLRTSENLSEHTHLVVACVTELYDIFKSTLDINYEMLVKKALLHDSLEMLRGDILSVTKDAIPKLREFVDNEEKVFISKVLNIGNDDIEDDLVKVADVMACYKFIQREHEVPMSEFVRTAYIRSKYIYEHELNEFRVKYGLVSEV